MAGQGFLLDQRKAEASTHHLEIDASAVLCLLHRRVVARHRFDRHQLFRESHR